MKKIAMLLWLTALCVLAPAAGSVSANPAQAVEPTTPTYSWNGELVALDQAARTLTVKSRVVGQSPERFAAFRAGQRIVLTWSGFDRYGWYIADAAPFDAGPKANEPFALPVEFVSFDPAIQYLTFKTQIPAASLPSLKSLKPGEWVTATSPHRLAGEKEVVTAVRPYVMSGPGDSD